MTDEKFDWNVFWKQSQTRWFVLSFFAFVILVGLAFLLYSIGFIVVPVSIEIHFEIPIAWITLYSGIILTMLLWLSLFCSTTKYYWTALQEQKRRKRDRVEAVFRVDKNKHVLGDEDEDKTTG